MAYLYVIANRLTKDDAAALRIISFCKILKQLGKDVIVISLDEVENKEIHIHKGIKYVSLRSSVNSLTARVFNLLFHKKRLKRCIENLDCEIEGLFFYIIPINSVIYLKRIARQRQIKIYHDSVEWYSPQQFSWGILSPQYILQNLLNRYLVDRQVFVFAISKFLFNYFQSRQIHCIRIPVMLDMGETQSKKHNNPDKLILLYAGTPGKKDYLKDIVEGFASLDNNELKNIELQLVGVTKKQLIEFCDVPESAIIKCGQSLTAYGRVPRNEVLKYLEKADFTVLLRSPELRYAKAGFPTKIVESLATGTPVMCNITSDLQDYLVDGQNSIIVEACTPEAFKVALQRALALSWVEKQAFCLKARKTAEEYFDYRNFISQFDSFICEK